MVKITDCFEMIDVIGSLKRNIVFSYDKDGWRMIPVLKPKEGLDG